MQLVWITEWEAVNPAAIVRLTRSPERVDVYYVGGLIRSYNAADLSPEGRALLLPPETP